MFRFFGNFFSPFQSSNLKTKADQARARTDTIYSEATENKRALDEEIVPGIEKAMVDVEQVTRKNKMVKHADDGLSK